PPAGILNGAMLVSASVMALVLFSMPVVVALCAVTIFLTGIGVHSIMSATAGADFGARKAAATVAGITDGFVYLPSALQSICVGHLVDTKNWALWPVFLIPFTIVAMYLAYRMWRSLPSATQTYLKDVEKIDFIPANSTPIDTRSTVNGGA